VFPNYLVQGGDPLTRRNDRTIIGTGGPGYTLPAEIRRKHFRGAVAAGRLKDSINPNRQSNGSQFYVCLQPIPAQDGQDTVFGVVIAGLPALDEISRLDADTNANPLQRVEVIRAYIIDRSQLGHPVQVR
jgi:cyclophilin family peptidyl-prolyl cis-trans isomerase